MRPAHSFTVTEIFSLLSFLASRLCSSRVFFSHVVSANTESTRMALASCWKERPPYPQARSSISRLGLFWSKSLILTMSLESSGCSAAGKRPHKGSRRNKNTAGLGAWEHPTRASGLAFLAISSCVSEQASRWLLCDH